jgi:hypothetical protein
MQILVHGVTTRKQAARDGDFIANFEGADVAF